MMERTAGLAGRASASASRAGATCGCLVSASSEDSAYITGNDIIVDGGWTSAAPYLGANRDQHPTAH